MTSTKKTPGGGKFYDPPFLCDKAVLNGGDLVSPCAIDIDAREVIELTVREVLARARKVDQRITRPAVVGALRSLLHNQAATRRAVGGRFIYAPVRGALTRARLLVGADPAGFAYPRMM